MAIEEVKAVVVTPKISAVVVTPQTTTGVPANVGVTTSVTPPNIAVADNAPEPIISSVIQQPVVATAYLVGVSQPNTNRFIRGLEELITSDSAIFNLNKSFSENLATLETFSALIVFTREVLETVSVTTNNYVEFLKVVNSNNILQDISTIDINKVIVEIAAINANIFKFAVNKPVTNTISILDTNVTIAVNYIREFEDLVDATDDYYGALTVGDDEYAYFSKVVLDESISKDVLAKIVGNTLQEPTTILSVQYSEFTKALASSLNGFAEYQKITVGKNVEHLLTTTHTTSVYFESVSNTEYIVEDTFSRIVDYIRDYEDNAAILEVFVKYGYLEKQETASVAGDLFSTLVNYNRQVDETSTTSEFNYYVSGKYLVDANTLVDTSSLNTSKVTSDSISIGDLATNAIDYLREFQDLVDATDDYYGAATIGDDEYVSFTKVTVDSALHLDVTTLDISAVLTSINTNSILDIPVYNTGKFLTIDFASTESDIKTTSIVKLENFGFSETNYFNINPVLNDTANNLDTFTRLVEYFRDFTESNILQDLAVFNTSIIKQHNIASSDLFTRTVNYRPELFNNVVFSENTISSVSKVSLDISNTSENLALLTGVYFLNTFNLNDLATSEINYLRSFQDLVDATDDYYGAATIGDDEYVSFTKVTVDSILQQDITKFDVSSILADSNSITDNPTINTGKYLAIQFNSSEIDTKLINSLKLETVISAELNYIDFNSVLTNSVATSETFSRLLQYLRRFDETNTAIDLTSITTSIFKQHTGSVEDLFTRLVDYQREFTDLAIFSDYTAIFADKAIIDAASSRDSKAALVDKYFANTFSISDVTTSQINYLREFEDLVDATDDYYGAATVGDDEYASFTKVTVDSILNLDISAFDISAILANVNTNNITDTPVYNTSKILNTQFNSLESNTKLIYSTKLEIANISELNYINISSVLSSNIANTDAFTRLVEYLRNITETNIIADLSTINTNIVKQNLISISDLSSNQVSYLREFEDLVDATDDYYGAAIVGDDEYASFTKVTVDNILQQDVTAFDIAKILANNATITEVSDYNIGKFLNNQITNTETNSKVFNSLKINTIISTEINYFNIASVLDSTINNSDLATTLIRYLRNFTETNTTEDLTIFDTSIFKEQSINISELFARTVDYLRSFEDLLDATDDYYGAATVGDDEYASFTKVTVDSILQQDVTVFHVLSILADSNTIVDTPAINTVKYLTTQFNNSEFNTKLTNNLKLETIVTSELKYFNISSVLSNNAIIVETKSVEADKYLLNTFSNSDTTNIQVDYLRNFEDLINTSDYINYFDISQVLLNTTTIIETKFVTANKYFSNTFNISDLFSNQISYLRSFEDLLDATDDYYGAATVGDDEYASFTKVTVDSILQQDFTAFDVSSILADSNNTTDTSVINTGKFVTTLFNSSETNTKTITSIKLDVNNTSDLKYFNISSILDSDINVVDLFASFMQYLRNFTEINFVEDTTAFNTIIFKQHSINNSDLFSRLVNYNKEFTDTIFTSEFNYYYINKYLSEINSFIDTPAIFTSKITGDNTSISDLFSNQISYLRSFEDLLDATDDYYGAATAGDDEYASFTKVTVDSILSLDISVFDISSILADSNNTTDTSVINTGKFVTTLFNSSETNTKTITSIKLDVNNTSDLKYFNISSILDSDINVVDLFASFMQYLRNFTETGVSQDLIAINTSIIKQDNISITDLFTRIVYYRPQIFDNAIFNEYTISLIDKSILDIGNINESKAAVTGKYLLNTFNVNDLSNNQVNYLRSFEELLDATDDYYGAATVGDDEYASFTKVIVDSILQQEVAKFNVSHILADSNNIADNTQINTGKYLIQQLNNTDSNTKSSNNLKLDIANTSQINYFNISSLVNNSVSNSELFRALLQYLRSFTETKSLQELININSQIIKQDNISISEIFSKLLSYQREVFDNSTISEYKAVTVNKSTLDSSTTSDGKVISTNKYLLDILSRSDLITTQTSYLRNFQDLTDVTDDYYGAATVGDDEYATFTKVTVDSAINIDVSKFSTYKIFNDYRTLSTSDSLNNNLNSNKTEIVTPIDILTFYKYGGGTAIIDLIFSTDSGTINNQNYFASSYVTPGYAGTNTYFGT